MTRPRQHRKSTQDFRPFARLGTPERDDRHDRHRHGRNRDGHNDRDREHRQLHDPHPPPAQVEQAGAQLDQ
ncbi:hypothetical protein ABGB14_34655 [Nonomuraea sp. B10E15]|uniref:hypothetical protein n=1 Tax=Nonomuraea sp. B10E15 TaxID=3153560 RepID=UPI00325DF755